jgi:hypothetical protein
LASQDSYKSSVLLDYLKDNRSDEMIKIARSAFNILDPTSTLPNTHFIVYTYLVDFSQKNIDQQVKFERFAMRSFEEFHATNLERANRAGGAVRKEMMLELQASQENGMCPPDFRKDQDGIRTIKGVINVQKGRYDFDPLRTSHFFLKVACPLKSASYRQLQYYRLDDLVDRNITPPSLPKLDSEDANNFRVIYCHPQLGRSYILGPETVSSSY